MEEPIPEAGGRPITPGYANYVLVILFVTVVVVLVLAAVVILVF